MQNRPAPLASCARALRAVGCVLPSDDAPRACLGVEILRADTQEAKRRHVMYGESTAHYAKSSFDHALRSLFIYGYVRRHQSLGRGLWRYRITKKGIEALDILQDAGLDVFCAASLRYSNPRQYKKFQVVARQLFPREYVGGRKTPQFPAAIFDAYQVQGW